MLRVGAGLRLGAAVFVATLALGLTGCMGADDGQSPSSTAPPSSTPTAPPDNNEADPDTNTTPPSETPDPNEANPTVNLTCDRLLTAQQAYDFNPNFALALDYKPAASSPAAKALSMNGVACSWQHLSSDATLDISVAIVDDSQRASLEASAGQPSSELPATGYFLADDDGGVATVFTDKYWVTASSAWFEFATDAAGVISDAIGNLP